MPRAIRSRTRLAAALATLAIAAGTALAACAPVDAGADAGDSALPEGLAVSVQQGRLDVPKGRLVVHFENSGDPITVTALEVRSPALEPGMDRDEPFELSADDAIDIRLDLTPTVCDGDPTAVEIALDVRTADGVTHSGVLVPDDPFGTMTRIADAACLAESVAAVAKITMPERLRSEGTGADRRAWIDVRIDPAAEGDGTLSLEGVSSTTLLGNEAGQDWPLGFDVAPGDAPFTIELAARPARCDAHALADDKRGTILPFTVSTGDGREGRFDVPSGDALKADLYAYIAERCGLQAPGS
ncbi:hypothetical protein BCL57_003263 [Agromyces flavus]|uniref:Lipoprotein n=1 Tax=Agromyces flavus TaxID=589382 RepID=A0A1H1NJZ1_9MICO|nr:hypothetical protein [Agromyces flavus]MCP2369080.1 hypothetical protein [Agromyces flavus]GGI48558.1 hypothetical protein GCM10010932_32460 [Agromyces flavus]SDR99288.1 hypothetical protein SAMN04489721_0608 [Agromyces flavus]